MDNRLPAFRPDVVATASAPRPTPTPPRVPFAQVLASAGRSIVAGAESALGMLPGAPMVAVATRSGAIPLAQPMSAGGNASASNLSAEGPGARSIAAPAVGGLGVGGAGATGNGGVEQSLQQAQEMNLYYLQIQEQVNQQNRVFSTLSNVMKAEHETVKTAIGNIR